jgi:hypothetical protein
MGGEKVITETDKEVNIEIRYDDVCESIAQLRLLREYCEKKEGAPKSLIKTLTVADEVMQAFCFEHFEEELNGEN